MKVCFVHIRLCIASGHAIPNVNFEASCLNFDYASTGDFQNCLHPNIKKPASEEPFPINIATLEENERKEILLKLKGFRYDRDLFIETYANIHENYFTDENLMMTSKIKNRTKHRDDSIDSKPLSDTPHEHTASKTLSANKSSENEQLHKLDINKTEAVTFQTKQSTSSNSQKKLNKRKKKENVGIRNTSSVESKQTNEDMNQNCQSQSPSKASIDESELSEVSPGNQPDQNVSKLSSSSERFTPSSSTECPSGNSPKQQLTSIQFFSGNPAVDITNGITHLYKSNYHVPVGEDEPPPQTNTLCMLSVPASIDAHGLMEFIAPYSNVIHQMRIIRDRTPNQYMVLLMFVSEVEACQFFINMNNQQFSSLIPEEICHLAFVASVEALPPYENGAKVGGPYLPLPHSTELPDCMVCLERMDESVQGLLTILCNHSFHAACLQQWEDLCCPVCRYMQTPEPQSDNKCMVCGTTEELWICLVCGHVGCGRYASEHAQRHYLETYHNYAMALSDNRVWDYAGDYFVHRLFQNKEDGKLVEKHGNRLDEGQEAKLEGIQLECMHLLTSQLESQRQYWEEQLAKAEQKAALHQETVTAQLEKSIDKCDNLDKKIKILDKEKQSLSKRNENLSTKLRQTLRDLANERELNNNLAQNQNQWKIKVEELEGRCRKQDKEINDLKDQLRDVMFYIEASQTIKSETKEVQEELRDGQVLVGASGTSGENSQGKKRGKGRATR